MLVLGIETSCDETAAAIVRDGREILASKVYSQIKTHQEWGGVVPELASREHLLYINEVIKQCFELAQLDFSQIDLIAVTNGPGLLGSLLVGINTAKTLSWIYKKELVTVNHLHGHICANYLECEFQPPFLCLLVSGGHTQIIKVDDYSEYQILGTSIDDACGEAFDKVAKLLDLDYPGGPSLDKLAQSVADAKVSHSNIEAKAIINGCYKFPVAQVANYDFSFSGLKTAVLRLKQSISAELWNLDKAKIAYAFQETVAKTLIKKMKKACADTAIKKIVLAGGVAANSKIRTEFSKEFSELNGFSISKPKPEYCTDNAAMIASAGFFEQKKASRDLNFTAFSR